MSVFIKNAAVADKSTEAANRDEEGKFKLNGKHVCATWSKSTTKDKDVFHDKLKAIMPPCKLLFGGRKFDEDGTRHYRVVLSFEKKVNWPDAVKKFTIDSDAHTIRLEPLGPRQNPYDFLENAMAKCGKDGDTFGERLDRKRAVVKSRKRKWQDIIDEPDEGRYWLMIHELDRRAAVVHFSELQMAFKCKNSLVAQPKTPNGNGAQHISGMK
ncbi:hypothetical protein MMC19_003268 [Ptychographa xylographoides]|nr:hypothetical protein [Ptychographa xylographoides]